MDDTEDQQTLLANLKARSAADLEQARQFIVQEIHIVMTGPLNQIHRRTAEAASKILHRLIPDAQAVRFSAADVKTVFGLSPNQIAKLKAYYEINTNKKAEDL